MATDPIMFFQSAKIKNTSINDVLYWMIGRVKIYIIQLVAIKGP